jgi:uncharacterized repeat protein (TIGR01451 family)
MIDILYAAIRDKIKQDLPAVKWIDLDSGQLDNPEQSYPFPFPAIFIDFPAIDWQDAGERMQDGQVQVSFRIAFRIYDETHGSAPDDSYDTFTKAMDALHLMTSIHAKLQGFSDGATFNRLSRITTTTDRREDGLKVFNMVYACEARDKSAMKQYEIIDRPTVTIREEINKSHLRLSGLASNSAPAVGSTITLTFLVENTGTESATEASVIIELGSGLKGDNDDDITFENGQTIWSIGTLAKDQSIILHVLAEVLENGAYNTGAYLTYKEQPNPASHDSVAIILTPEAPPS